MSHVINDTDLQTVICYRCRMSFAMPAWFYWAKKADQTEFHCPAGHSQMFPAGKTEAERLRERLTEAEMRAANLTDDLRFERLSHAATKGKLTKTKKRVANGVCPCCNRSFVQLERHMKSQHPEYP